ncbi:unnamed protein product, partial [Ranitomeya imitator]
FFRVLIKYRKNASVWRKRSKWIKQQKRLYNLSLYLNLRQKMPQGRRAHPTPNLSKASLKTKVSTEEQHEPPEDHSNDKDVDKGNDNVLEEYSSVDKQKQKDEAENRDEALSAAHNGNKASSVKPLLSGRGRLLQRPKPNLTARTSTRKENLDVPDSADVLTAGTEKCAEHSDVLTPNKKEHCVKAFRVQAAPVKFGRY